MTNWAGMSPVLIRLTGAQALRLKKDWYYSHARYTDLPSGQVELAFGESNREFVFELLRWLGPGAELLEPQDWRAEFVEEMRSIIGQYSGSRERGAQ
jgi:predicted DNA-binding transcriptional regulator YafY